MADNVNHLYSEVWTSLASLVKPLQLAVPDSLKGAFMPTKLICFCFLIAGAFLYPTIEVRAAKRGKLGPNLPQIKLAAIEGAPMVMVSGEQRRIRSPGMVKYSPSGDAARITTIKDDLFIKAVKTGNSDLWIWKADGQIEHRSIRVEPLGTLGAEHLQLGRDLGILSEAEVIFATQAVVLRGMIDSPSEMARIRSLKLAYPKLIYDETSATPELIKDAASKLGKLIQTEPSAKGLRVQSSEHGVQILGTAASERDRMTLERKIYAQYAGAEILIQSLPDDSPVVHFKVFLLELKKSKFGSFGLSWPAQVPQSFNVTPWGIKETISIDAAIDALEGDGSLKVLSRPELVVRAPGEAELFAGGEIPISLKSEHSSQMTWKPYGLLLKLKITHSTLKSSRLDISTEASHLDYATKVEDVPGLQSNRMKTQVDATFGVPLLLSGLLREDLRTEARGIPLLRKIPILGALFGSEDFLNERSELVAVLYPQNSPSPPPMQKFESDNFIPKGKIPVPRTYLSPESEALLRAANDYPWNCVP